MKDTDERLQMTLRMTRSRVLSFFQSLFFISFLGNFIRQFLGSAASALCFNFCSRLLTFLEIFNDLNCSEKPSLSNSNILFFFYFQHQN